MDILCKFFICSSYLSLFPKHWLTDDGLVIELHVVLAILAMMMGIPRGIDAVLYPLLAQVLLVLVRGHRSEGGHGTHSGQEGDGAQRQRDEWQIPRHFLHLIMPSRVRVPSSVPSGCFLFFSFLLFVGSSTASSWDLTYTHERSSGGGNAGRERCVGSHT